jgi:hypothetical protein
MVFCVKNGTKNELIGFKKTGEEQIDFETDLQFQPHCKMYAGSLNNRHGCRLGKGNIMLF